MPRVSVILPVYNSAHFLRECADSVLGQSFTDWELIAVDDGSDDGSGLILDEYAASDSRIRVLHKDNGGVWAARNDALELAKGEWVTFLDADDMFAPYWLEEAMQCAAENRPAAILQERVSGEQPPASFSNKPNATASQTFEGKAAAEWYWRSFTRNGFLWMWFVRRDIIGNLRFRPVINCKEDGIWLLELAPKIEKASFNDYPGYFYRNTATSLSKKARSSSQCKAYLEALADIWGKQEAWLNRCGISTFVSQQIKAAADHDVIEWVDHRNREDNPRSVYHAYRQLLASGAIAGVWRERDFYQAFFWFWKKTGCLWPLECAAATLDFARALKRRLFFTRRTVHIGKGGMQ